MMRLIQKIKNWFSTRRIESPRRYLKRMGVLVDAYMCAIIDGKLVFCFTTKDFPVTMTTGIVDGLSVAEAARNCVEHRRHLVLSNFIKDDLPRAKREFTVESRDFYMKKAMADLAQECGP